MLTDTAKPPPIDSPSRLPKWSIQPTDFWLFIALILSSMVVFSNLIGKLAKVFLQSPDTEEPPLLVLLSHNLGMQLGMLLAFVGFAYYSRSLKEPPSGRSFPKAVAIGAKWLLITYLATFGISIGWRLALNAMGFEHIPQDPVEMAREGGTIIERTIIYSMIVLVAPVCEELVFRGIIFRYLHHRLPLAAALCISALLFASIHVNLYSFAPLFAVGLGLAAAYREAGTLVAPIFLHMGFNTLNLLLILAFPQLQ